MKEQELIAVTQLPIIEERLLTVKSRIENEISSILSLACTTDTVKAIKNKRTQVNKIFLELELQRINIKKQIFEPYNQLEKLYDECVKVPFKTFDKEIVTRIAEVENTIKDEKRAKAESYFNEYALSKGVEFLSFDMVEITITLSISDKAIRDRIKEFVDRVSMEISTISAMEHSAEIMVEYKRTLNLASSITTATQRLQDIQSELELSKEREKHTESCKQAAKKIMSKIEFSAPSVVPLVQENTEIYRTTWHRIVGPKEEIMRYKELLKKEGFRYEQQ